jgi:hypothetical protein
MGKPRGVLIALMTEAASISETSVNFYQTTWRYSLEDSHLHNHRRQIQSEVLDVVM